MTSPLGGFTAEALEAYQKALAGQAGTDFAEGDSYDFTTCIRPDGSAYGTGGKCRKGTEGGPAEKAGKTEMNRLTNEIKSLQSMADKARENGFMDRAVDYGKKAGKLIRERADLKNKSETAAAKKPEAQDATTRALEMVKANARARGLVEIKRGESKAAAPSVPANTAKKPYPQSYDWRNQSGTFRKSAND